MTKRLPSTPPQATSPTITVASKSDDNDEYLETYAEHQKRKEAWEEAGRFVEDVIMGNGEWLLQSPSIAVSQYSSATPCEVSGSTSDSSTYSTDKDGDVAFRKRVNVYSLGGLLVENSDISDSDEREISPEPKFSSSQSSESESVVFRNSLDKKHVCQGTKLRLQDFFAKARVDAQNIPKDFVPDESTATSGYPERRSSPEKKSTKSSRTSDSSSGSSSSSEDYKPIPLYKIPLYKAANGTVGPSRKTKALGQKKNNVPKRKRYNSPSLSSSSSTSEGKPVPITDTVSNSKDGSSTSANEKARALRKKETPKRKRSSSSSASKSSIEAKPVKIIQKNKIQKLKGTVNIPTRPRSHQPLRRASTSRKHTASRRTINVKNSPKPGPSKEEKIECTEKGCDTKFTRKWSLKRHLREVHGIGLDEKDGDPEFKCRKKGCIATFKRKPDLTVHLKNVHSHENFSCEYCGKSFKCLKSVKEHQRRTCRKGMINKGKKVGKHKEEEKVEEKKVEMERGGDDESSD